MCWLGRAYCVIYLSGTIDAFPLGSAFFVEVVDGRRQSAALDRVVSAPVGLGHMMMNMTVEKIAFATGDLVVYPTHGVGKITAIETQEIAGHTLSVFVVNFDK